MIMGLDRLNQLGQLIAIAVVVWSCLRTLQVQPTSGFFRVWFQLILYYARYMMVWVIIWSGVMLFSPLADTVHGVTLLLALLYVYSSWIEPNRLSVNHVTIHLNTAKSSENLSAITLQGYPKSAPITALKIAVVSDIHVGIFSGHPAQLSQLVNTLNQLDVSAILVTGDWLYHAGADILGQMVIFKTLNKPCYTVLSEQDYAQIACEPNVQNQLTHVLETLNIQLIMDKSVLLDGVTLVGVSTKIPVNQLFHPVEAPTQQPVLVLTHDIKNLVENANHLLNNENPKLIIAGQTHGGQVFLPYLTKALVQAMTGTQGRAGLSTYTPNPRSCYQVWTTTGTGMTGLPFRLNCPPSIDVLTLYL